ncbi:MAG: glycoside hydrolase family 1 protein [Actinomycetia bacterium]|nr:glycoside hydrolase family 1 protein [Actinomycetes bacterium]
MVAALLVVMGASVAQPAGATPSGKFPKNFMWGVATSDFQSGGSFPDSNWTRYAAKSPDPYQNSADFRHRYPEDIARAKALGVKVFRTSIEWARIEPRRGVRDATALAYYDDLVRRIRAAGMRPMLTLDHWVYPGWVADQGAWDNPATAQAWLDNARFVVNRYKHLGVMWITFNEPFAYLTEEFEHRPLSPAQLLTMRTRMIQTHLEAYELIHRIDPGTMVTSNTSYGSVLNGLSDAAGFNAMSKKMDFIGIDYYYGASAGNLTAINAAGGALWKITSEPEGLYYVLKAYQKRFPKLAMYVVENGMPTENGKPRADGYTRSQHLRDHIYWIQRALADGVHVIGYNYWSITDNYEWGSYSPRFGLYTVDVLTDPALTRRPTDAVATYQAIIRNQGVPTGYVPVRKPAWCSIENPAATCFGTTPTPPAP